LLALTDARGRLTRGDGWAFYQRLVDKWGTNNFSPRRREGMSDAEATSSAAMAEAWEDQDLAKSQMLTWMQSYDAFVCPVDESYAETIDRAPDESSGGSDGWTYRGVFNCTGWPVVVVRAGSSADGRLPIGVQVVAPPWREDIAIALAANIESRSGGWRKPPI
jgi:amidase